MIAPTAPLPFDQPAGNRPSPSRLAFEVPGEPQPQGSAKAFKHRHTGRVMVTSDNARLRPWRDAVCWHAQQALLGGAPLIGAVKVRIEFRFARPGGHFGKRGLRPAAPREHVVRPDLDKLVRAVLDALSEAGVWRDDAQVVETRARKRYHERPGAAIEIGTVALAVAPCTGGGHSDPVQTAADFAAATADRHVATAPEENASDA